MTDILMPALSPTMEEGTLAKWHVKVGDKIASGDVIAEIETDKATMEVEAVDEGVVEALLVAEGTEGVKVNAIIARLVGEVGTVSSSPAPAGEELRVCSPHRWRVGLRNRRALTWRRWSGRARMAGSSRPTLTPPSLLRRKLLRRPRPPPQPPRPRVRSRAWNRWA